MKSEKNVKTVELLLQQFYELQLENQSFPLPPCKKKKKRKKSENNLSLEYHTEKDYKQTESRV